jgi:5'-AMP-activated protein kinase, regulatory gamma subunit
MFFQVLDVQYQVNGQRQGHTCSQRSTLLEVLEELSIPGTNLGDACVLLTSGASLYFSFTETSTISFITNLTLHVSSSSVLRLVVIEPSTRFVEGVISLKDIFTFLLG